MERSKITSKAKTFLKRYPKSSLCAASAAADYASGGMGISFFLFGGLTTYSIFKFENAYNIENDMVRMYPPPLYFHIKNAPDLAKSCNRCLDTTEEFGHQCPKKTIKEVYDCFS